MPIRPCLRLCGRAAIAGAALALIAAGASAGPIEGTPPYPPSTGITGMALDWGSFRRLAPGSDNWPATWAQDGGVYTLWGDGNGFGGSGASAKVSIGVARLSGDDAGSANGTNLIGGASPRVAECFPLFPGDLAENNQRSACYRKGRAAKSYGALALGDRLYAFLTPGSLTQGYKEARLYAAPLGSNAWRRAAWAFTKDGPGRLLSPGLLQAGRNHADLGGHVYAYAARHAPTESDDLSIQKGPRGGEVALLRAPKGADLLQRSAWQFLAGVDGAGRPSWTGEEGRLTAAITDRQGVGWTTSAVYVKGLGRYLVATQHTKHATGRLTLLEAPEPWGPWRTVAYTTVADPQRRVQTTGFYFTFLPNSFSGDGRSFTLVFTGRGNADALLLIDGRFTLGGDG